MGAATVSRLHADLTFMAGLEAAKAELATARAKNLSSQRDCKFGSDGPGGQLATNIRNVRSPLARLARQEEPLRCSDDVVPRIHRLQSRPRRPFSASWAWGLCFGRSGLWWSACGTTPLSPELEDAFTCALGGLIDSRADSRRVIGARPTSQEARKRKRQ